MGKVCHVHMINNELNVELKIIERTRNKYELMKNEKYESLKLV